MTWGPQETECKEPYPVSPGIKSRQVPSKAEKAAFRAERAQIGGEIRLFGDLAAGMTGYGGGVTFGAPNRENPIRFLEESDPVGYPLRPKRRYFVRNFPKT